MDRAEILCAMDAFMMQEFSRHTIMELGTAKLFRLILAPVESFVDSNVRKEIDKDADIIRCAADAWKLGRIPGAKETRQLLQKARVIDRSFLSRAGSLSSGLQIPYGEIDPIRLQRIEHLLNASYGLLIEWERRKFFRIAVQALYTPAEFRTFIRELLQFYIRETTVLSSLVVLPRRLPLPKKSITKLLQSTMELSAARLSDEMTNQVYTCLPNHL